MEGVEGARAREVEPGCRLSGCIWSEHGVAKPHGMAGSAGFELCLGARFAVFLGVCVSPPAGRGIFFGILDHKLNVGGLAGNKLLWIAEDLIIFLGRDVTEVQRGDKCAVRKRKLRVVVGLDRHIIPQNHGKTAQFAFLMSHGDQFPVSVSRRTFDAEDRDGVSTALPGCWRG